MKLYLLFFNEPNLAITPGLNKRFVYYLYAFAASGCFGAESEFSAGIASDWSIHVSGISFRKYPKVVPQLYCANPGLK